MSNTRYPRVRIVNHGQQNWRTEVLDCDGSWFITGPPFATKLKAYSQVDETISRYF